MVAKKQQTLTPEVRAVLEAAEDFGSLSPHDKLGLASMRHRLENAARAYAKARRGEP